MSFLTCFWLFPQNEHLSRSPLSPIRATPRLLSTVRLPCSDHHDNGRHPHQREPCGRECRVPDRHVTRRSGRADQTGTALREVRTPSMIPYSRACSAVRYLSRSMSRLTSSVLLPVSVASMSSISDRI